MDFKQIYGSFGDAFVIGGTILFLVPAVMFLIRGITDKRGVMFAVHMIFTAFWVRVIWLNAPDYLVSLKHVIADLGYFLGCTALLIVSVLVWYAVIHYFFPKKN